MLEAYCTSCPPGADVSAPKTERGEKTTSDLVVWSIALLVMSPAIAIAFCVVREGYYLQGGGGIVYFNGGNILSDNPLMPSNGWATSLNGWRYSWRTNYSLFGASLTGNSVSLSTELRIHAASVNFAALAQSLQDAVFKNTTRHFCVRWHPEAETAVRRFVAATNYLFGDYAVNRPFVRTAFLDLKRAYFPNALLKQMRVLEGKQPDLLLFIQGYEFEENAEILYDLQTVYLSGAARIALIQRQKHVATEGLGNLTLNFVHESHWQLGTKLNRAFSCN